MFRRISIFGVVVFFVGLPSGLMLGQEGPRPGEGDLRQIGTVKKIDVDGRTVTLRVGGKDLELPVNDRTELRGVRGDSQAQKLKGFPVGTDVTVLTREADGKRVLVGMMVSKVVGGGQGSGQPISPDHTGLKPLDELGREKYQGFAGGFYPDGQNKRPAPHEAAGLKLAENVQPRNPDGKLDSNGKIVLLSIGMSNTSQSFQGFLGSLADFGGKNPRLVFVNGAQGGMTASAIQDPNDGARGAQYWTEVDNRLKQAGVTRQQVQAIWIKQADAAPSEGFPAYAQKLQAELLKIVQVIADRFPNARLCYLSSRAYGGYAVTPLNPEPYAYESGFAVKWLIEEQLKENPALNYDPSKGAVKSPWLSWGPYLWANGLTPRAADGFNYQATDFAKDGTRHSPAGSRKIGVLMLNFFTSDTTTKGWFNRP